MRSPLSSLVLFCLIGCRPYEVLPPPEPVTEAEIIRMSKEGVPPEQIIQKIRDSRTIYVGMGAADVVKLHENGVDDKVIDYMLETEKWDRERRAYYSAHHYWAPVYYPYPYWPHAHVGFGWHW